MMLVFCSYYDIVLVDVLSSPCIGNKIDCLSGTSHKDNLFTVFCIDEFCYLVSSGFVCKCCLFSKLMDCPVNVRIVIHVIIANCLNHLDWLLSSSCIIKVNKRFVFVYFTFQNWKVISDFFYVYETCLQFSLNVDKCNGHVTPSSVSIPVDKSASACVHVLSDAYIFPSRFASRIFLSS